MSHFLLHYNSFEKENVVKKGPLLSTEREPSKTAQSIGNVFSVTVIFRDGGREKCAMVSFLLFFRGTFFPCGGNGDGNIASLLLRFLKT